MDVNKRMTYFDGKKILFDEYEDTYNSKFDQNFDDTSNLKMDSKTLNKSIHYPQERSDIYEKEEYGGYDTSKVNIEPKLLDESVYTILKERYYKSKGYIENRPEFLLSYLNEFKTMVKKSLKIPNVIAPLLKHATEDVKYTLEYYYNKNMELARSTQPVARTQEIKPKFTSETLKRLYQPKGKTEEEIKKEKQIFNSIEKFSERLIDNFFKKHKAWTNDKMILFDYWKSISDNDKEKLSLTWDAGENNLQVILDEYFSDDALVNRLQAIFTRMTKCQFYGERPLHDFWSRMSEIDRYRQAIYVYLPDDLYTILRKRYEAYTEELKKTRMAESQKWVKQKELEESKYKRTKEEFGKILEKCDKLCKPKDKWKTGRVMLGLRKKFNFDSILKKMIKHEFKENKKFKFPEEYAVYDSDEENDRKKILFQQKSELTPSEQNALEKEKEKRILESMHHFKLKDDENKTQEQRALEKLHKEDVNLEKYLKKQCISFLKIIESRLQTKENGSINKFLTNMYAHMKSEHKNATKRRFPKINYEKKKKKRFNDYPLDLKIYFFNLLRRLTYEHKDGGVKFKFGRENCLAFWAPSMSNGCKVHRDYCPLYCKYNSHNKYIKTQKKVNFNNLHPVPELNQAERLHLWKRNELAKEKEKIFLCYSEVEHCTFEPRLNIQKQNPNEKPEEVVAKRLSNKEWVLKMGDNFQKRFPLINKEGQLKVAKIAYQGGDFSKCLKILEANFNIELIKCHFDKKFHEAYKKRLKEEALKKEKGEEEVKTGNPFDNNNFQKFGEKEIVIIPDDFTVPKNAQICAEVFDIIMDIESFKKEKKKEAKKIEDEVKLIKGSKLDKMSDTLKSVNVNTSSADLGNTMANTKISLAQTNYIKDKYFKLFKSIMCPLKEDCPHDLRPRWPHTGIKSNTPFGLGCPYAHHVSELKFEQEIKEKIKLKLKHLEVLNNDRDPIIKEWIPAGPLIPCTGCGKSYTLEPQLKSTKASGNKGLCGFCRYSQHNNLINEKERKSSAKANVRILKNMGYVAEKPEDWDMDFTNKFGLLQKATVLYNFRRYLDSLEVIGKAKTMVESEQKENDEKFNSINSKWKKKLQIDDPNITKEILNYVISQDVLDYFNIKTPLSTFLIYVDKVRKGSNFSMYNRHTFLNNQILNFYALVEKALKGYKTDIIHIKKQIGEIDLWLERKEKLKTENPKLFKKFVTNNKIEMCPNIKKNGKCSESYRNCKFAHSSVQLNKTEIKTQKKILQNNLIETQKKLKHTTTMTAWKPPKQGHFEKVRPDKQLILRRLESSTKRSHSAKRTQSIDITKLKINFHEI